MHQGGSAGPQKLLEALCIFCSGSVRRGQRSERAQGWVGTSGSLLPHCPWVSPHPGLEVRDLSPGLTLGYPIVGSPSLGLRMG